MLEEQAEQRKKDLKAEKLAKSGMTKLQMDKKEGQKKQFSISMIKCIMKKNKGADKFKLGQYGEASQIYQEIIEILQKIDSDFPLYKQEVGEMEATIYNNLAACAKKELNSKLEIEYTTKVIEREEHIIEDENTILKAYLRRGLAYEQMEKFELAKEDMLKVKSLQSNNLIASKCLETCNKNINKKA